MPSLTVSKKSFVISISCLAALLGTVELGRAYINQSDGSLVPATNRMQQCLDRAGTGESTPGAVDAREDARILPEAYRPVEMPLGSGEYPVVFKALGEGAGYRNTFGYYFVDEDPTDPANLRTVFDCRPNDAQCACPCDPEAMRPGASETTINFKDEPGFVAGRAIGFWLRTPELVDGSGNDADNCGGRTDTDNRIYFTSKSLNDDGDFVHFLVYESQTFVNSYYFGFEDLFRGGDNDYEDMLVRANGLVPLCTPGPESCNDADDDCDLKIDENVNQACSTTCGSGVRQCVAGTFGACSASDPSPELCDNIDNNCNGQTDEGLDRACSSECGNGREICVAGNYVDCTAATPRLEICNNDDDDCDGKTDEGLSRSCSSICGGGVQVCAAGVYGVCSAAQPTGETCNGIDDDCDGIVDDGLTRPCASACGSGIETCISGAFVGCSAQVPALEVCNNLDDDCDGDIDEGVTRVCSTACGVGEERCEAGTFLGCTAPQGTPEVCNNLDDDCDGVIDDGNPGGGPLCVPSPDGYDVVDENAPDSVCSPGTVQCVEGVLSCIGSMGLSAEVCNCLDDDCDGEIDEGSLCEGGACVACACASPCARGEFPCPTGRICDRRLAMPEQNIAGFCVPGKCAGVVCKQTEICDAVSGDCKDVCDSVTCAPNATCVRGQCAEDNCYGLGCPAGQRCREAACMADPCADVQCEGGSFCRDGNCIAACTSACSLGESCQDGQCAPAPCRGRCTSTQSCVDGTCVDDTCESCGNDRVCHADRCIDDLCAGIRCPAGTSCSDGNCGIVTDRPPPRFGLATGGGGSTCAVQHEAPQGSWFMVGLLGFLLIRRRRATRSKDERLVTSVARMLPILATAVLLFGCEVDPYCFGECEEDGGRAKPDASVTDGCIAQTEVCNGQDEDCDGQADEDFDLQSSISDCGGCGVMCNIPQAFPVCVEGDCRIDRCEIGFVDLNGSDVDGCEYRCEASGDELCDEIDNDCDGKTDEGIDLQGDVSNCGTCANACLFQNASASCSNGTCTQGGCNPGFVDVNGDPLDGCEYACVPNGAETCNSVDDDCDRSVDEGFDTLTDVKNCGACGRGCFFPSGNAACIDGACILSGCAAGAVDINGDPLDGCEYACVPDGQERCNNIDDDCDGAIDEADALVGQACGSNEGTCLPGVWVCENGNRRCAGETTERAELCNDEDDDCDGKVDESTLADPVPGVGERCGETNTGACSYGTVICTGGALDCAGTYQPPVDEICDGIDNDCDGTADDSPLGPTSTPTSCQNTTGVCAGRTATCEGGAGWQCAFPDNYQLVETQCDGDDNDCDGDIDEGCLTPDNNDQRIDTQNGAGTRNASQITIAGDGGARVFGAWVSWDPGASSESRLFFARTTNGGDGWGAPQELGTTIGPVFGPDMSYATGGLHALWPDFLGNAGNSTRSERYRRIVGTRSANNGNSFATSARVNGGQAVDSFNVDVTASGDNVFAVYEAFTTARTRHIFFVRSDDAGVGWSTPLQVDHGMGANFVAATPKIATRGSRVHVVWRDNRSGGTEIFYNRSNNSGASFGSSDVRLSSGVTQGSISAFAPSIAAEGSNVYVSWVDNRAGDAFDIFLNRSNDNGGAWRTTPIAIDQDGLPHESIEPRVVTTLADTVVVSWVDYRFGFPDILSSVSVDAANSFESPRRVDTGTEPGASGSYDITMYADGSLVAIAWADDRAGLLDIYVNFSLDGGLTYQPQDYRMDTSAIGSSDSQRPHVWVADDRVHVLWEDNRAGQNADVYYNRLR